MDNRATPPRPPSADPGQVGSLHFHLFSETHAANVAVTDVGFLREYGFHHDVTFARARPATSCAHRFHRSSRSLSAFPVIQIPPLALLPRVSRRTFLPFPLLSPTLFFCLPQTVVREIRPVSNFDHANIRWLRRVTPLRPSSSR